MRREVARRICFCNVVEFSERPPDFSTNSNQSALSGANSFVFSPDKQSPT